MNDVALFAFIIAKLHALSIHVTSHGYDSLQFNVADVQLSHKNPHDSSCTHAQFSP